METTLPDFDAYEVRVFDARRGRHLVAAIAIVSPTNEDRPEHRNVFVARCVAPHQEGAAVSVVDLVNVWHFNLHVEVLAAIGHADPTMGDPPPDLYAASCRWSRRGKRTLLEAWSHVLTLGGAVADVAALAGDRPRGPAQPGMELRASLRRLVNRGLAIGSAAFLAGCHNACR